MEFLYFSNKPGALTPVITTLNEILTGTIERVTFHNQDTGFCVLKIKNKNKQDLIAVTGSAVNVTIGEYIECHGTWVNDKTYGLQFKAETLNLLKPDTLEGIERYLGSGLIKGIGKGFAKRLVKAFGLAVFDIIENTPHRLLEVEGLTKGKQEKILLAWEAQKKVREIVMFLHSYEVGTARAVRIYKTYGDNAITKIKENPYRLALDIRGIGFKTADVLAMKLGIGKNSLIRSRAGVRHILQEHSVNGHCAALVTTLVDQTAATLEIEPELVVQGIEAEIKANELILDEFEGIQGVFLASFYKAEVAVSNKLKNLKLNATLWEQIDANKAITWVEDKVKIKLSSSQMDAIRFALTHKIVVITGGPGVGKTTVVNSILKIIASKTQKILLCAPTGRAAKRLSESTGMEAKTLHRLLETRPHEYGFVKNEHNQLDCDLLVVDEISMVDILMMSHLLKAIPKTSGLILVGDVDQLPSVGPGSVLANIIDSETIPTIRLTEIFRQASTSQIIVNAHRINQGSLPKLDYAEDEPTDFYFIKEDNPELIQQKLIQIVAHKLPQAFNLNPLTDIQVLSPMNKGNLGTRFLNIELQKQLNPSKAPQITKYGTTFSVGDKVIQTVNNYDKDVFNGDIGFIKKIDQEESEVAINFEGHLVNYDLDELDEIALAYAITIHKSQGSEYPAIVMPLTTQHYILLERNLLYTGVTRGKSLVVIIGQVKALGIAVNNKRASYRLTKLAARLRE